MTTDRKEIATTPALAQGSTSPRRRFLSWASTLVLLGVLATYLALSQPPKPERTVTANPALEVQVLADGRILVPDTGPFAVQLQRRPVMVQRTTAPLVQATGTLLAAMQPSAAGTSLQWQFATGELLSTYADLLQADADVAFHLRQTTTIANLHRTKTRAQEQLVDRLRRLVEIGSDAPRELAMEEARLLEIRLEAERDAHEAENALLSAQTRQSALTKQLEQVGLPPDLLRQGEPGGALLVAEIPEPRIDFVREGQACRIVFYGRPDEIISGKVARVLPTVSAAQRTLRAAIVVDNGGQTLRPGMFANVGLGTEEREALMVPATAVIHVRSSEYVLVAGGQALTVTEVVLGEGDGPEIEVLKGIEPGMEVITEGAVLLKPTILQGLTKHAGPR
jgi:multidrug efflux pump subunit AcrA (membrane-fusion protein)